MNLVASMIVRNELDRYLRWTVPALLDYVDEIRVLDDHSDDGTREWLEQFDRVSVKQATARMTANEGVARQELLEWTFEASPSHVLAIDADELVLDSDPILDALEQNSNAEVFTLSMVEVWGISEPGLSVRVDGGWAPRDVPILYAVPERRRNPAVWRIAPRAWASGREPRYVRNVRRRIVTGAQVLHLGWACEDDRRSRYDRHMQIDGGKFHAGSHLESILWPNERVKFAPTLIQLPTEMPGLLERIGRVAPSWTLDETDLGGGLVLRDPTGFPLVFVDRDHPRSHETAAQLLDFLRHRLPH